MAISIQQHSKSIASKIVGVFKEDIPVRAGFSAWFPRETTPTLHVDIQVERDSDPIAVDVQRFTEGNKNKRSITTEKKFKPPYYREEYDFSKDDVYLNTIALGVGFGNANVNRVIAENGLRKVRSNRKKIERAIRKQQAQVLQTGIVTLENGDNIDFKRKAGSIVDLGAGSYWNEGTSDPIADLRDGMTFLRDEGNSNGSAVNVVMRGVAFENLLSQLPEKAFTDNRRIDRASINMPQFSEATGMAFQGRVAAGDFTVNIWTYNEKYTDANGATQYYLDSNKVVMIPDDFRGKTVFGGLPTMRTITSGGVTTMVPGVIEREFLLRGYSDEKTMSSTLELTSAPLVIPFTIDKVYTIQVLA